MIKIKDYSFFYDGQPTLNNANLNIGHQMYVFSGNLNKRKSTILEDIAKAFYSYNQNILYSNESSVIYLPGYRFLLNELTLQENIVYFSKILNINTNIVEEIVIAFKLESILTRKVSNLSIGQKQMARICCAFLNYRASVVILDQPFRDLEKEDINLVKKYINTNFKNKSIIISKNSIIDLEEFNPRQIIIKDNKLLLGDTSV